MRRLLSVVVLVAGLAAALAGCPEQNVDPAKYPDAWWLPGADASVPDGSAAPTDAATWIAVPPPSGAASYKLRAIAATAGAMLAVGDQGTVFSYDPVTTAWTNLTSTVSANLTAVASVSTTDFWIAGDAKTVLHYDGSGFTAQVLPGATSPDFKAIAASPTEVWVAGAGNARFKYDRATTTWTDESPTSSSADTITGLWFSGTKFWQVDTSGAVYSLGTTGWTLETTLPSSKLNAIWGFSDDDFWLVGSQVVWHYTQQATYTKVPPTDSAVWSSVWGSGPTSVFVGSKEQGLLKWNGLAWERCAGFSLAGRDLYGIGGSALVGTWSVGDSILQRLQP
ncbi:MAG: hypothetical protein QM765_46775 [Myxococcales bacterium]